MIYTVYRCSVHTDGYLKAPYHLFLLCVFGRQSLWYTRELCNKESLGAIWGTLAACVEFWSQGHHTSEDWNIFKKWGKEQQWGSQCFTFFTSIKELWSAAACAHSWHWSLSCRCPNADLKSICKRSKGSSWCVRGNQHETTPFQGPMNGANPQTSCPAQVQRFADLPGLLERSKAWPTTALITDPQARCVDTIYV